MIITVLILYILASLIYLLFGDGSTQWGGINIITQYFAIAWLSWFVIKRERTNILERVLFYYAIMFNILSTILTAACIVANVNWIYKSVYWCSVAMGVVFVVTLAYGWFKYKHELGER